MAKAKNKKNSGLADKVHSKKKADMNKKKLNPFEVHINREKMKVLGKKSKHDKGLPGVSRAKAIQKRKETLGTEMKIMNKTNTFIDRRIGEKNGQLSSEDRMIARFAAERARQHNRKNMYNLADDEVLTHRGQTLEQIEKFDDPRSSDDEDNDGKGFGGLDDEFVSEGHFGGGVLSKTESKDGAKSHKDLIEQLIAESKKRKLDKQKEKEKTLDLTDKLDSEWVDLQPVVFKRPRIEKEKSEVEEVLCEAEKKGEEYDKMMRELKFEKRGVPSDSLKTDEKQAREEEEKLAQWEKDRQLRMMDDEVKITSTQPTGKHRSAEDLDDNFELDDQQDFMLAYDKDGKPLLPDSILKDFSEMNSKQLTEVDYNNLDDLRQSDVESDDEVEATEDQEKIHSLFNEKSEEGDKLRELLTGKTPTQQSEALKRLIKSYDPSLSENNKEILCRLFAHLLQYINDLFTGLKQEGDIIKSFLIFDKLAPHLFDLAVTNKVSTKKFLVEVLKEKHDTFMRHHRRVPDLDTLIFFKLVSLLYPTSDFRHPVATPSFTFMTEILTLSKFRDAYSISRGLFVLALILEYIVLSKRFVPSALNFLRGILYVCADTSVINQIQVVPPFSIHRDRKILQLECDCSKMAVENKMAAADLARNEICDEYKIRCFFIIVLMLKEFFVHYNDIEAQECIFSAHMKLLARVNLDLYPEKVSKVANEVLRYMKETLEVKTYTPLCKEKKRIKVLRLYEPDVQEVFTGGKSSKLSREQASRARLQTRHKRELRGALREIRRDKAYVASVKLRDKIRSDNIRKEKVKQIYKEASVQQGELNKLKRSK